MKKSSRTVLCILFAAYGIVMLYLLFWQRVGHTSYMTYPELLRANLNLIPFRTIRRFITVVKHGTQGYSGTLVRFSIVNLLGNILVFIPLGLFLPCLWVKLRSFPRFLMGVAAIVVTIEVIQLFTLLGSCDIDDVILNMLGASVGYRIYRISAAVRNQKLTYGGEGQRKGDKQ